MKICSYWSYQNYPEMKFLSSRCSVKIEEKENYCWMHKYECKLNSCLERAEEIGYCYQHKSKCWIIELIVL